MKKRKKSVKKENGPVIGEGLMAQINKSNMIQYNTMSVKEINKALNGAFGQGKSSSHYDSRIPDGVYRYASSEKITRRKAPWECNKK